MGAKSKRKQEGPLVVFKKNKDGEHCVKHLSEWCQDFGFPLGGSLSLNQIEKLEKALRDKLKY